MRIKIGTMAILISVIVFGGIGATMAMDIWTTENKKTPVRFEDGDNAGEYNPTDIRGSYTFEEISTLFEVDLQVLYQAFDVPTNTNGAEIQSKDIETIFGDSGVEVGNESMQIFVALYKGLPVVLDDKTFLPTKAVNLILEMNKNLTDEQIDWMDAQQAEVNGKVINLEVADGEEIEAATEAEELAIMGTTTFQQVIDLGVTEKEIEEVIGSDMPPSNMVVKTYCLENDLSFTTLKEKLLEYVDSL